VETRGKLGARSSGKQISAKNAFQSHFGAENLSLPPLFWAKYVKWHFERRFREFERFLPYFQCDQATKNAGNHRNTRNCRAIPQLFYSLHFLCIQQHTLAMCAKSRQFGESRVMLKIEGDFEKVKNQEPRRDSATAKRVW
jgi:hypothetical protein